MKPDLKTAEELDKRFNAQYPELLKRNKFPEEKLSKLWIDASRKAMYCVSPLTLGVPGTQFYALVNTCFHMDIPYFNMRDFAFVNTAIELCTATQLGFSLETYCKLMVECEELAEWWNKEHEQLRNDLEAKIIKDIQAEKMIGKSKMAQA